jgi:hypothetical protein
MYAFEIAATLLFLSFIVSLLFFGFLVIHSIIEERRREATWDVSRAKPASSPARQPSRVPSSKPAT